MTAVRMNITLPEDAFKILNKRAKVGERSAYIAEAIRAHAGRESQEDLVKRMIEGYQASNNLNSEDRSWLNAD